MERRERDESSSKLEEALRELTGAEPTGKMAEYENEQEDLDVRKDTDADAEPVDADSEIACTNMERAERMPIWRREVHTEEAGDDVKDQKEGEPETDWETSLQTEDHWEEGKECEFPESGADVIDNLDDDDWELDELDDLDEPEKPSHRTSRLAAIFRPSDDLLAAFFLPVVILVLIFAYRGIFPFGQESFLRTDMYHQYAPFFSEFRHKLLNGESLLYSWDVGMGVNFAALYAYYLASPSNWLLLLCPSSLIIEFMTYMIVLKSGLAGLSMAWYLKKHTGSQKFGACYFGVFYALSGYMAAYSWNIMWLDCIVLFPLILYGLERLVRDKKGLFYCLMLGLSILSNYYISIMICLFMVIYYVALLFLKKRRNWKDCLHGFFLFGVYSLLAGALAAAVLLPEIAALQSTASGDFNFPTTLEIYFPIFDMIARHIGNVQVETGLDHWPNLYCGVAVYIFMGLYFLNRRIAIREKVVYGVLLLFFYASFSFNVLNFIWHGFHYPNSLPCRQSFIYIVLVLTMCFRAYLYLDEITKRQFAGMTFAAIGYVILAQKLVTDDAFEPIVWYAAAVILLLYLGVFCFYQNKEHFAFTAALLAMALVGAEALANMAATSIPTTSRTDYVADNKDIMAVTEPLQTTGFYRIDKTDARTKNDGAWLHFPSASLFSSVANAGVTDFFKQMGCEGSTNAYSIVGSTPLVDSLFSIKYALYEGKQDNPRLSLYAFSGDTYLYENPWTLPLGFILPDIVETGWKRDLSLPVDVQNDLSDVLGVPECLIFTEGEEQGNRFSFTAPEDGEYYISVANRQIDSVQLSVGEERRSIDTLKRGYLVETGYVKEGTLILLESKDATGSMDASAYHFEEVGLRAVYERLNQHPFELETLGEDAMTGTIDAGEGGTLFLSIPYDEGWTITVDGKKAITRPIWKAFTGVELAAGTHTVKLKYYPQGLQQGLLISGGALLVLLVILVSMYIRKKKQGKTFLKARRMVEKQLDDDLELKN